MMIQKMQEENFNNSINQFSELMNRRAKELGCKNTKFLNPNGIHNNFHYSTARDLAIIGQEQHIKIKQLEKYQLS